MDKIDALKDCRFYIDLDGTVFEWHDNGNFMAPHYFRHLPEHKNMVEACKILKNLGLQISFATAVISEEAIEDKRLNLNDIGLENIPMIAIPYGENKSEFLPGKLRILLDDHTPNCNKFDGKAIKFINAINHKQGKWTGPCIDYKMTSIEIATTLITQAYNECIK